MPDIIKAMQPPVAGSTFYARAVTPGGGYAKFTSAVSGGLTTYTYTATDAAYTAANAAAYALTLRQSGDYAFLPAAQVVGLPVGYVTFLLYSTAGTPADGDPSLNNVVEGYWDGTALRTGVILDAYKAGQDPGALLAGQFATVASEISNLPAAPSAATVAAAVAGLIPAAPSAVVIANKVLTTLMPGVTDTGGNTLTVGQLLLLLGLASGFEQATPGWTPSNATLAVGYADGAGVVRVTRSAAYPPGSAAPPVKGITTAVAPGLPQPTAS